MEEKFAFNRVGGWHGDQELKTGIYEPPKGTTHIGFRNGRTGFFKSGCPENYKGRRSHLFLKIPDDLKENKIKIIINNDYTGWKYAIERVG